MSSIVNATASDHRKPCKAKNLICGVYFPNEPLETSSHVKNSGGLTIILGPVTPWAGDASIISWAKASRKTVLITANDIADVCGGRPWIVL
jgi:hypothetical protein